MPADHGTPNTGDEREAATTYQDALAAACGTEADGPARSPQGEDHEALMHALESVLGPIDTEEAAANAVEAVYRALGWRPDTPSPSRDGTAAVEDVLKAADRLAERHVEGSHARVVLSSVRPFFEREFGVSERTERIHDQATKEKR